MPLEYKILQSQTPLFASYEKLQGVLAEEARAGWQLLEKEDNFRIKLQRDISHRDHDANLGFDPYRSTVGLSPVVAYGAAALVTLAVVTLILFLALWR